MDRFLKLLSRWLPVCILVVTVFNLISSYGAENHTAVSANIVALIGWLYVVMYEFTGKNYVG